ncbi:hypothetical protein ICN17_01445 [Polynucleobacter sp. 73C-SIWE]|nr:hypothetical protein [Polynucleobacter sp. 73C-SIWE]
MALLWIFGLSELLAPNLTLVPHDTFYPLTDFLTSTSFATFNSAFNYSNNLAGLMVLAPDAFVIYTLKLLLSNHSSQIIHILLCLVVFHGLSYFSLQRIFKSKKLVPLLALCYCFSPYSSVLYSAGIIYQLSTVIGLGILPLLLYNLMSFEPKKDVLSLIALITLLAFGLLFIYPTLLLISLTILIAWKNKKIGELFINIGRTINAKNAFLLLTICIPFFVFIYLTLSAGNNKDAILANGAGSAIQGGIFYPLMQISAWGIYNVWSPRAILNFHAYFFDNPYRILSITLPCLIIYFLYRDKKFIPIIFVLFLAFFAKGPNPPFGDLFSLLINHFPLGYMIRSPDSKFGAFIAAWFMVSIVYLPSKQRVIIISLSTLFLLSNLGGMFYHGAISSNRGNESTTSFISDPEAAALSRLIQSYSNTIVVGNFADCANELYENKFHTCHGLLSTNLKRQLVHAPGNSFIATIQKHEEFAVLALINKRQENKNDLALAKLLKTNFTQIYNSENYEVVYKPSINKSCSRQFDFSCVQKDSSFLLSIPEPAYKYYFSSTDYMLANGIISVVNEPPPMKDWKRLAFLWSYAISYLLCLGLIFTNGALVFNKKSVS